MNRRAFVLLPLAGLTAHAAASPPRPIVAVAFGMLPHSAEWVTREIAAPFERSFAGLPGLTSMKSVSSATHCLIELGYAGPPSPEALGEAESIARTTWNALQVSVPQPSVRISDARLE